MAISELEIAAVVRVLRSGWLTTGNEVFSFEKEFADYIGGGVEAIAVNSNTAGMHLVLEAAGIGPGDEVIVPTLTFTATAEVVRYLGADVVFVDVDADTLCIDPVAIEKAVTSKTKAIMVVHYAGLAADMPSIQRIAQAHNLKVIEDAAHSFPATSGGRFVGSLDTTAAIFSFYANKTITTGEGGMIVTRDAALAKRCRVMRLHGLDRDAYARFNGNSAQWRYDVIAPGFKYNLTDIAAALGREQLRCAESLRVCRQAVAERFTAAFAKLPIRLPVHAPANEVHSWHLYPIRIPSGANICRGDFEAGLMARNIGYSVHYTPLHRMTYWNALYQLDDRSFPVASDHGDTTISLPIFSAMTDTEVEEVIDVVISITNSNANLN